MSESTQLVLRKVIALGVAVMMVVTLSAIAVVKADHSKPNQVATGANTNAAAGDYGAGTDTGQAAAAGGDQSGQAAAGQGAGAASGGGSTAAKGPAASKAAATAAGQCTDANPNVGVFCDHFLVGGTTVLSGPLAVYGDQGLKGGLAWLTYYNTVVAPKEHLRQGEAHLVRRLPRSPRRRCSTCSACTTSTRSSTSAASRHRRPSPPTSSRPSSR